MSNSTRQCTDFLKLSIKVCLITVSAATRCNRNSSHLHKCLRLPRVKELDLNTKKLLEIKAKNRISNFQMWVRLKEFLEATFSM